MGIAEDAIAAAQAAAQQQGQNAPSAGVSSVPAVQSTGTEVSMASGSGEALTMETIGGGQMSVDQWLKVKEDGLKIGDTAPLLTDPIKVVIDMRDGTGFRVKNSIKGGNPAQYASTYNNKVATNGKPWDMACAAIRALPGAAGATPYRCVDLPMTTYEKIMNPKGDVVLMEEGKVLGYSTSTTNWSAWEQLYKEVADKKLMGQRVIVELTAIPKSNKAGNKWGIVGFKLIGAAPEEGEE